MTPAILRSLQLLESLARKGPQGVSELSRAFQLPKSNIHRLLQSLAAEGFVVQDPTGRYVASIKLYELGTLVSDRDPIKRAALPFMQQLHQSTGETVLLAKLIDTDVVYVERVLALSPVRAMPREGRRVPAVFTASGRVILAHHPNADDLLIRNVKAAPDGVAVDLDMLRREFEVIRERGYAVTQSGWTKGVQSIAGAISGVDGSPAGAIALVTPSERQDETRTSERALAVMAACTQVNGLLSAD